jgi:hypothetical protein
MRGASEHRPLGADQPFDAVGSPVEATCQLRHLVVSFYVHPRGQVPPTECLHLPLQPFESAREASDDGIGPKRDRHCEQTGHHEPAKVSVLVQPARDHPPAIGEQHGYRWSSSPGTQPTTICPIGRRSRQWDADRGEQSTVGPAHGKVDRESLSQSLDRGLQLVHRALRPRQ